MTPPLRRATIRTAFPDEESASVVASALLPDNTEEMSTRVESSSRGADGTHRAAVVTTIERETTGGLQATVDDYVVNLDVAHTVAQHGRTTARPGVSNSAAAENDTLESSSDSASNEMSRSTSTSDSRSDTQHYE
ncbi:KEOPS complex subunit Pcc1 [Halobacteria archaeon AArc-curdl1]|uniref:KEOPS complex subunit Pcc1 n=1 Tax=Natronosalvus hydrolyticus TaxID=2979988 RepID=A0AAP2Z4W1_9EURY|nr:KEOPS complex subunit Pcc1 [Halobacteria archaeon AArc-curdl1]